MLEKIKQFGPDRIMSYLWLSMALVGLALYVFVEETTVTPADILVSFAFYEIFSLYHKLKKRGLEL